MILLRYCFFCIIIVFFIYSKVLPHKDKLDIKYLSFFNFTDKILAYILTYLQTIIPKFKVGNGLFIDLSQVLLLIILLLIYKLV